MSIKIQEILCSLFCTIQDILFTRVIYSCVVTFACKYLFLCKNTSCIYSIYIYMNQKKMFKINRYFKRCLCIKKHYDCKGILVVGSGIPKKWSQVRVPEKVVSVTVKGKCCHLEKISANWALERGKLWLCVCFKVSQNIWWMCQILVILYYLKIVMFKVQRALLLDSCSHYPHSQLKAL